MLLLNIPVINVAYEIIDQSNPKEGRCDTVKKYDKETTQQSYQSYQTVIENCYSDGYWISF